MGTTLATLTDSTTTGVELITVVAIEGIRYLLTDAKDTSTVTTAWSGTEWTQALSGLRVGWNIGQKLDAWAPFASSTSTVTLEVMDCTGGDELGLLLFKREGHNTTKLTATVDPSHTTVEVGDSSAFPASGEVFLGSEAIHYTANTGTEFNGASRGYWSPFRFEGGGGFARTHLDASQVLGFDADAVASTTVSDAPLDLTGRWVGVWLHRVVGGVLDVKAEAHLAFAGRVTSYRDDASGKAVIQCAEVRQAINEAVILRDQWRARVQDGIFIPATWDTVFKATDSRTWVVAGAVNSATGNARYLKVRPAGLATPPNEIEEGFYTGAELESKINDWLAAERAAGRLLFHQTFSYHSSNVDGEARSRLAFTDPTVSADAHRGWRLSCMLPGVRSFLGWDADGIGRSAASIENVGYALSANAPQRIAPTFGGELHLSAPEGSFVDQTIFMRQRFIDSLEFYGGAMGFVQVGDAILPCTTPVAIADGYKMYTGEPINLSIGAKATDWPNLSADAEGNVTVSQVLILEGPFKKLALALLSSTGSGINWTDYDLLPEHCSAAIPYDLLTTDLEDEITAAPVADGTMTVIVEKPTRLVDLLNSSFILRGLHLMWRQGRLSLRGYATPSTAATLSIGNDARATPADTVDDMRAVTVEDDARLVNVITIKHNGNPFTGTYRDTIVLRDPGSASNYGSQAFTLTARNAASGAEIIGEDVLALLPTFTAGLTFVTRPQSLISVPIDFTRFEACTPGDVCLFSDRFARNPMTGSRGLTDRPALIVGTNYTGWGGSSPAVGELTVMLFPRLSLAPYCPAAQVTSYNAGSKVLTVAEHELSEATDAADASRFAAGDMVRVIERDPSNPAAPLTWDDKVVGVAGNDITLDTGLAGYDAAKKYFIYSDDYGDAVASQQLNAYQADNVDGFVADLRGPYTLGHFAAGQVGSFTLSTATEPFEKPPDAAYGDGVALDTAHARAVARGINAMVSYLAAPQSPEVVEESTFSGSGTWQLVYAAPFFVGSGYTSAGWSRKLYVSPTIRKTAGSSSQVRVTLARQMPKSVDQTAFSRNDVVFVGPTMQHTFTTSSSAYENPTAVGLPIDHLDLGDGPLGGWGWLMVELKTGATFRGFGQIYVGPMVIP